MKKVSLTVLLLSTSVLTGCQALGQAERQVNILLSHIPGTPQHQQRQYYENMPRRSAYDAMYEAEMRRRCTPTVWSSEMRGAMGCH